MKNFREVCDEEQSSVGLILPCLYIGLRKYTSTSLFY